MVGDSIVVVEAARSEAVVYPIGVEAADAGMHVDQVGYLTGRDKTAMVTDSNETDFSLVDVKTNKVVYTGKLSQPKADALSEETLRKAKEDAEAIRDAVISCLPGKRSARKSISKSLF